MTYQEAAIDRLFDKAMVQENGCWLYSGYCDKLGYGIITYDGSAYKAHRLSYMLMVGAIPIGMCICHKCDTRNCVNPDHLYIGTMKDNVRDRVNRGRNADTRGEKHPSNKLKARDVIEIRDLLASGIFTKSSIAFVYGITHANVLRIEKRETWKHI